MNIQATTSLNKHKTYLTISQNKKETSVSFTALKKDTFINLSKKHLADIEKDINIKKTILLLTTTGLTLASILGFVTNQPPKSSNSKGGECYGIHSTQQIGDNETEIGNLNLSREEIKAAVDEILLENPDVKTQYNKINQALQTYSKHLGLDGLSLIKQKVDEIGDGKVDTLDVLKILFIESTGRIYSDVESRTILRSSADAYGAFQITKETAEYLNQYYGLIGTEQELDVEDPHSNLDACIYNIKFLTEKRRKDINNGANLPTGNDIKTAVAWSYHDGAWAKKISKFGLDYIQKFESLSLLDEYPLVVDYLLDS